VVFEKSTAKAKFVYFFQSMILIIKIVLPLKIKCRIFYKRKKSSKPEEVTIFCGKSNRESEHCMGSCSFLKTHLTLSHLNKYNCVEIIL
jgi:hypothetical protein